MEPYEYFEHTADIGLRARGADLAEAFANAGRGLAALIADPSTVEPREQREVSLPPAEPSELLIAWLNELLYLLDAEGFLPSAITVDAVGAEGLAARLRGERLDPARHEVKTGVKAATYHQARVECDGGCLVQAILDL